MHRALEMRMRRLVPCLLIVSLFACSASHDIDGGAGDACVPTPCAAPPPGCRYEGGDACRCGTLRCEDAGICASPMIVSPSVVCFDGNEVPALDLVVVDPGACFCGQTIACSARQDGDGIHVDVRAEACGPLCGACYPYLRGSCTLEGVRVTPSPVYDVSINGVRALSGLQWGVEQCWTPAGAVHEASFICAWPGAPLDAADVTGTCVPDESSSFEPIVVRASACIDDCFAQEAGCEILRTAEGGYDVRPLLRRCECPVCGACAPGCQERSFYCVLPPLEPGAHAISVAGSAPSVVNVSDAGTQNRACDDR